jgi:hypothetical protein
VTAGVPLPPPLDGVDDGAGVALGVAPDLGVVEEPFFFFFGFLRSPGTTGWPVLIGGAGGWIVWVLDPDPPPPLDAIATTTIRKNAMPTSATSRRRR